MKLLGARNSKTIVGLVCLMTGFFNLRLDGQVRPPVRMDDNSDWWSYLRPGDEDEVAGVLKRPIADATFKLLNIDLTDDNNDAVAQALKKLDDATVVQRGDGSTGRDQACYVSSDTKAKTYLIFERGELDSSFYLLSDGPPWNGRDLCVPSVKIGRGVSTDSGLHLGQTPKQVIGILGQPSGQRRDELLYYFAKARETPRQITFFAPGNNIQNSMTSSSMMSSIHTIS
jgi:hypothetical protein